MKVVIIGSGNVATVLGRSVEAAGHEILQVLSRSNEHAAALAGRFNCASGHFGVTPYADADIYIIAISDSALHHLDIYPSLGQKIVVHTAGSVSRDVLKPLSDNYGVIYPLQSLSKKADAPSVIPLIIDGNNEETKHTIEQFARSVSQQVSFGGDEERLKYHIGAVIVSNFTNHLYAYTEEFCAKENVDFKKLYPLIEETTSRIKNYSPRDVQTGPAVREDVSTLGKHLRMLTSHSDLKYLYLKLSESILKFHRE